MDVTKDVGESGSVDAGVRGDLVAFPDTRGEDVRREDAGPEDGDRVDARNVDPSLPPPRPRAPLSTMLVANPRPTLQWRLSSEIDGAVVELCRDRACARPLATLTATGTSAQPTEDLPPGAVFWRLRGRRGVVVGATLGPTWEVYIRPRPAPVNATLWTVFDGNGDGYADLAFGTPRTVGTNGGVRFHPGGPSGPSEDAAQRIGPGNRDCRFGEQVASAGDINGDGIGDLIVAAPGDNRYTYCIPGVRVLLGGTGGLATTAPTHLEGAMARTDGFGGAVAAAGDLDGDGYGEVLVGAQYAARVYVFPGGPAGISATPTATLESNAASRFGAALAGAGDVDGDGRPEVVVGASGAEGERGRVYVYSSNATGLATTPTATLAGSDMPGRRFGLGVAMGDLNGDGHADVVAAERGASDDGSVFIFFGSRTGLPSTSSVTLRGDLDHTLEPAALGVGDLNGDGYADLAIGARSLATGSRFVLVYLGQAAGPTNIPSVTIDALETERGDTQFGLGLELTGDVDSDGYTDLVIGAPLRGRAYLYRGGRPGVGTAPQATFDAGFDSGLGSAIAWIRRASKLYRVQTLDGASGYAFLAPNELAGACAP